MKRKILNIRILQKRRDARSRTIGELRSATRQNKKLGALKRKRRLTSVRVWAPRILHINDREKRAGTLGFIEKLKRAHQDGKKILLRLDDLEELHPCGTILVLAEIDSLILDGALIEATYPKNGIVEEMLQHVGLLERLGCPARKDIGHDMVVHWHYYTANDATFKEGFDVVAAAISDWMRKNEIGLLTGVSEAVTNTQHHAYPKGRATKPWWLFVSRKDDYLAVAVCDLGRGIPRTLPKTLKERLGQGAVSAMKSLGLGRTDRHDGKMIQAALEYGRTRTQEGHRGKGLSQMQEVAKENEEGYFAVYSGRGFYFYKKDEGREGAVDYSCPIEGTVVLWKIKVDAEGGQS